MPRKPKIIEIPALGAIHFSKGNIARQLAQALRDAIAKKELQSGSPLPSTRAMAESLKISRGTVSEVYDQLIAEGWLVAKAGSGTCVESLAGETTFANTSLTNADFTKQIAPPKHAEQYAKLATKLSPLPSVPFSIAVPEGEAAMDRHWQKVSSRVLNTPFSNPVGYCESNGFLQLRVAISNYLRRSRAVNCQPENIIVTEGTQQALYLSAMVLLQHGDIAWAEDPAYPGLTSVLDERGINTYRGQLDEQGFDVAKAFAESPEAKVAYVTPSHQYPIGMPLSMSRRLALLDWARQNNTWVVEDDYDSELRYAGHPFPAMQGMDSQRVIYMGTFSKVLAPSLRLGYLVVPDCLIDAFTGARALLGRHSSMTEQHILAAYMQEGYFETHIKRINAVYKSRRKYLIEALKSKIPALQIQPADQGMHIVVWLPEGSDDVDLSKVAMSAGVATRPISPMCSTTNKQSGLMLGFGGFTEQQLEVAVDKLAKILT